MVKILVFLFSFFSFSFQPEEPVSWKYELDKIDNYQYKLTFNAKIIDLGTGKGDWPKPKR